SPITTSGTGGILCYFTTWNTSATNSTCLTHGGSGAANEVSLSWLSSGSASAVSIGATLGMHGVEVISSNTNAITGAGTLISSAIFLGGTSVAMNVTTNTLKPSFSGGISFDKGVNTLNQYVVGTWTPAIVPSGTAYTSITYTTQAGYYTRIGNLVTVTGYVLVSTITVGPATGDARLSPLPFTADNSASIQNMGALRLTNVTLAST